MHDRSSDLPTTALDFDPLSEVLQDLRLSGVSYGRCELSRPWGIEFPAQRAARFHFIASGEAWLRTPDGAWVRAGAGDAVLLPKGARHALADRPNAPTTPIDAYDQEPIGDAIYHLSNGGTPDAVLFCGSVGFREPMIHPVLELMPPYFKLCEASVQDAALEPLLGLMTDEVLAHRMGSATVLSRLADVVIARMIRGWVERCGEQTTGWVAAIRDPSIGRALAAIHREPGKPWSVDALAGIAHLSRSRFSERFSALIGASPARYLARWRMHVASAWLQERALPVAEVALRLGYDSEASFSRAFKRNLGLPPGALRRRARQSKAVSV